MQIAIHKFYIINTVGFFRAIIVQTVANIELHFKSEIACSVIIN